MDQEEHGLAQRYPIQALRLARTASDFGLGAEILLDCKWPAELIRNVSPGSGVVTLVAGAG